MLELVNKIIEMSVQASFVICIILIVRFVFLKINVPKQLIYVLWAIPLFRLVCPVTIATKYSLMPADLVLGADIIDQYLSEKSARIPGLGNVVSVNGEVPPDYGYQQPTSTISQEIAQKIQESGGSIPSNSITIEGIPGITDTIVTEVVSPTFVFSIIWLIGICALVAYSIISTALLHRKMVGSVWVNNNYYRADHIDTPFVLGIIRPKIYLPSSLAETDMDMIIKHEEMHIRRKDHIVKLVVFAVTCVHWFNPWIWVLFMLFCRDMESAVDEKVISKLDVKERQSYATLLLALSTGHKHRLSAPLAFGEGDVKGRIKNVMKYKKPVTILVVVAAIVAVALAVGLMTSQNYLISKDEKVQHMSITYGTFFDSFEEVVLTQSETLFLFDQLKQCKMQLVLGDKNELPFDEPFYTLNIITGEDEHQYYSVYVWEDRTLYKNRAKYLLNSSNDVFELLEQIRTQDSETVNKVIPGMSTEYIQNNDGTWSAAGYTYKYRLVLSGVMNNAAKGTVFTVLSNDPNITFEEAVLASGISSNMDDYFTPDYAMIVDWKGYDLPTTVGLPIYTYTGGDSLEAAICNYMVSVNLESDSSHETIRIPAPVILKIDRSDLSDIKVWGNFWAHTYKLEGTTLMADGGGEQPGIMHLSVTDTGYVVTGFEGVRDGSYFVDDLKALCKGHFGLYQKFMNISKEEREQIRTDYIKEYVEYNQLNVDRYQDFGWDPVYLD